MTTPVRRQYLSIKDQHPDAILLFRMGDFYEAFDDDAEILARDLDIVLTAREMGRGLRIPMAGIPYHALNNYLGRLVNNGRKVAICEQIGNTATTKGLLNRAVSRVVTPGTLVEPSLLEERTNNYLASVVLGHDEAGVAYTDISTSNLTQVTQVSLESLYAELERIAPAEILVPFGQEMVLPEGRQVTVLREGLSDIKASRTLLLQHLNISTLDSYGCENMPLAIRAAGSLWAYLRDNQPDVLARLSGLTTYDVSGSMVLDPQTRRNLELVAGARWGTKEHSLLSVLDVTRTPMGARMLRRWLGRPLLNLNEIHQRHQSVDWFHRNMRRRQAVCKILGRVSDMERLITRIRSGTAIPRELVALLVSLDSLPELATTLKKDGDSADLEWLVEDLPLCEKTASLIRESIEFEPGQLGDGSVVRKGFSSELDDLRLRVQDARRFIAQLESQERNRTGIKNLKVGYNRVFGYYIEVTNPNLSRVPDDYQRRQTLTNGERFITPELKEHENLILNAREKLEELEISLYRKMCAQVGEAASEVLSGADIVASIDVLAALAEVAGDFGYVRPTVNCGPNIDILNGRHPMVERVLLTGGFVPNSTNISLEDGYLAIITGPNMSGKSTYIRQVALIVLMAQMGSFVPAESATIGLVDRIFTRVGLQDDMAVGQSTFMVEMVETANILHNATNRSLLILDEIGRGTSTYDGLSIAQAVAEHIHSDSRLRCRTLFATHYHELTRLADNLPGVRNYNVGVVDEDGKITFLHRILPGGTDRSYGVHVAQLAGLPIKVVQRAWDLLLDLEDFSKDGTHPLIKLDHGGKQLEFFTREAKLIFELMALDVNKMTPLEAMNELYRLHQRAKEDWSQDFT